MPSRRRNGPGRLLTGALPAALLSTAFLCGCKKPEAAAPPPPIVEVMEITTSEVPLRATLIGQLDSPQNVEIRARVEAFVKEAPFTEGKEVKKDAIVFQLDDAPYQERLKAAEGSLAEAKAALAKYQADVARLEPLLKNGAIPKQDLDNAKASVEVGNAGVQSAEALVSSAKLDIEYCKVHAPITGLIGAKQVSIGDLVGKGEPTLLATMSTLDPIWFYCNVGEVNYIKAEERSRELGKDIFSLPLTLILADGKELPGQGRFVFIDRAVDAKTGTMRVRAEFPNPTELLRPGMFARVRVDAGTYEGIKIPGRAIVELQGQSFAWIVDGEQKAHQRPIKVGDPVGSDVAILDGLQPGERIIVEGVQKVRNDAEVQPMTAAEMARAAASLPASGSAKEKE